MFTAVCERFVADSELVRDESLLYLTSLTNSLMVAEITRLRTKLVLVHYTHRDVLLQNISCLVFWLIFGTHDGHTHTIFCDDGLQLTDTTETAADLTSTKNVVHSFFCVNGLSRLPGCTGIRAAELGCGRSPE